MLRAIDSNKAGRVEIDSQSFRWREIFKRSEDLLTSVFFSRVPYLTDDSCCYLMSLLIGEEKITALSHLTGIEFWPSITGLEDRTRVEPDVLLWFNNIVVMVEVKPPFGGHQYLQQWKAQIKALEVDTSDRGVTLEKVYFVPLGGNGNWTDDDIKFALTAASKINVSIHPCEWENIQDGIYELKEKANRQDKAVIDDWVRAFGLFGMSLPIRNVTWKTLFDYSMVNLL